MRESYPRYNKGNRIRASTLNTITRVLKGMSVPQEPNDTPFLQRVVIVLEKKLEPSDDDDYDGTSDGYGNPDDYDESSFSSSSRSSAESSSQSSSSRSEIDVDTAEWPIVAYYWVKPLYYDHTDRTWKIEDVNSCELDVAPFGIDLEVNDVLVAYWDPLRSAYVGIPGSGSGGGCATQNAIIDISIFGRPTGGTLFLNWDIDGEVTTGLGFAYNATAAQVKDSLTSLVPLDDSEIEVTGGPWPNSTIRIEFKAGKGNRPIALPVSNWNSLTGGSGVGVICALAQLGHE